MNLDDYDFAENVAMPAAIPVAPDATIRQQLISQFGSSPHQRTRDKLTHVARRLQETGVDKRRVSVKFIYNRYQLMLFFSSASILAQVAGS